MRVLRVILITLFHVCLWDPVLSYGTGAPDVACSDLSPRHYVSPDTSPAPFLIEPLQDTVEPGGTLTIRLSSKQSDSYFRGFFIQARNPSSRSSAVLGYFLNPPANAKTVNCSPGYQNALTHRGSRSKTELEVKWQAPRNYEGDIVFKCTFVKDFSTFWLQVSSPIIRVTRAPPTTTTTTPAPTTTMPPLPVCINKSPLPADALSVYHECNLSKGCFGSSNKCLEHGNCSMLLTYVNKNQYFEFELWGINTTVNAYVAMAFSKDSKMGNDTVIGCFIVNDKIRVQLTWNDDQLNVQPDKQTVDLQTLETKYADGNLYCKFIIGKTFSVNDVPFNLDEPHYLLLAKGIYEDTPLLHDESVSSSQPISLTKLSAAMVKECPKFRLDELVMPCVHMARQCFCISSFKTSSTKAYQFCERQEMKLLSFETADEMDILGSFLNSTEDNEKDTRPEHFWTSGVTHEGKWKWNSTQTFIPDDWNVLQTNETHCLGFSQESDVKLNMLNCNERLRFVCKN